MIKFLQVNLNHCKLATALAADFAIKNNLDVLLLQDPHVAEGRLQGFPLAWRTCSSEDKKAWIAVTNPKFILSPHKKLPTSSFATIELVSGPLVIGTQYAAPRADLQENLAEWIALAEAVSQLPLIVGGDFNAKSPVWGSPTQDARGESIQHFAAAMDLHFLNDPDAGPTYVRKFTKETRTGWPDLTTANTRAQPLIHNWRVLEETETLSDHNYITFTYGEKPDCKRRRRYRTKYGNHAVFKRAFKSVVSRGTLVQDVRAAKSQEDLELSTSSLIAAITEAANRAYRLKAPGLTGKTTWWTPELSMARNRLTALKRRTKKLPEGEERDSYTQRVQQARAAYRKLMLRVRKQKWEEFCQSDTKPYGFKFKLASGKIFQPHTINVDWKSPKPLTLAETQKRLAHSLFKLTPTHEQEVQPFERGELPHSEPFFTPGELKEALFSLNPAKAPGHDNIDFLMLRQVHDALPSLLLEWANKCLQLSHFPRVLKIGEVIYFHKKGKDPSEAASYRPICLLPTLGKLLEKLLQRRLVYHLETNNMLSQCQFGFRESKSCETAVASLLNTIKENQDSKLHTMVVSFDVKGAFDTVSWKRAKEALKQIRCPTRTRGLIYSFLSERQIRIDWGSGHTDYQVFSGCPQGSCLGPVIWLLIAESYLQLSCPDGVTKIAFADDFVLIITGQHRRMLETIGKQAILEFESWADSQGLTISTEKSSLMVFTGKRVNMSARMPSLHYKGRVIKAVESLKYLGLILDSKLSWRQHILHLKVKTTHMLQQFSKVASRLRGQTTAELRHWYLTVAEKRLLYGAGVWAEPQNSRMQDALNSLQRPFLLKVAKAYVTTPSSALQALTAIPPLHLTARKVALQAQALRGIVIPNRRLPDALGEDFLHKSPTWSTHPALRCLQLKIRKPKIIPRVGFCIYTDGSKTEHGVGAAYASYLDGEPAGNWAAKLGNSCSVFQAELKALEEAIDRASKHDSPVTILSDSLSGLQALSAINQKNNQVQGIKRKIIALTAQAKLPTFCWIPAHTGIIGNEKADQLAKAATEWPVTTVNLPAPPSLAKRLLREQQLKDWQDYWDQAETGRKTHSYVPKVSLRKMITPSHATTALLTGHGPFLAYLHRFKRADSANCVCGATATAEHYMFDCTLTKNMHFKRPADDNRQEWAKGLLTNKQLINKSKQLYAWLVENQELLQGAT